MLNKDLLKGREREQKEECGRRERGCSWGHGIEVWKREAAGILTWEWLALEEVMVRMSEPKDSGGPRVSRKIRGELEKSIFLEIVCEKGKSSGKKILFSACIPEGKVIYLFIYCF